jgi:hypothetical protein
MCVKSKNIFCNYSDIFRIYLTSPTVAMPVVTIEQTSVFPPSNCIIP